MPSHCPPRAARPLSVPTTYVPPSLILLPKLFSRRIHVLQTLQSWTVAIVRRPPSRFAGPSLGERDPEKTGRNQPRRRPVQGECGLSQTNQSGNDPSSTIRCRGLPAGAFNATRTDRAVLVNLAATAAGSRTAPINPRRCLAFTDQRAHRIRSRRPSAAPAAGWRTTWNGAARRRRYAVFSGASPRANMAWSDYVVPAGHAFDFAEQGNAGCIRHLTPG
jgi:hypothetical protein